ncbi:MAG: hypothetical protein SFX18_17995 [Pirellulales bacterium]|nr:hypothetical protein [Pirellulales bacterium]
MVYEYEYLPFYDWLTDILLGKGPTWYFFALFLGLVGLSVIGALVALVRLGPAASLEATYNLLTGTFFDIIGISPRRVYALSKLVILEAWRRRVWFVLVIFAAILIFSNLFLTANSDDPGKLYTTFSLGFTTRYLALFLLLILSVFSIPQDFKNKTIFTVATKPVRTSELILGRICGFMALGTFLLVVMGTVSYFYLVLSLQHTHDLDAETVSALNSQKAGLVNGKTTLAQDHFHLLRHDPKVEEMWTEFQFGHRHEIIKNPDGSYTLREPEELLRARVQQLGTLKIRDEYNDETKDRGVSVGKEWSYRSFIEGSSPMAAIWTFKDITPERFPRGLRLERTIRVFRTSQGVIDRPLSGTITLRNPQTRVESRPIEFLCKDNEIDTFEIPLLVEVQDKEGNLRQGNLFEDFVSADHELQILVQCSAPQQYFGMAQRDLYIKGADIPFEWNLVKALFCMWLQMLIIVSCGVFFSTVVSAPVALLCTVGFLIFGMNLQFINDITTSELFMEEGARLKKYYGGGPLEATYRIFTGMNVIMPLEKTPLSAVIKSVDRPILWTMYFTRLLIPNFDQFNTVSILQQGFNIPGELVAQLAFQAFFFAFTAFLLGVALLRLREVAS